MGLVYKLGIDPVQSEWAVNPPRYRLKSGEPTVKMTHTRRQPSHPYSATAYLNAEYVLYSDSSITVRASPR